MKRKAAHKGKSLIKLAQEKCVNSLEEFKESILPGIEEHIEDTDYFYKDLIGKINLFVPGKFMWYVVQRLTIFQIGGR